MPPILALLLLGLPGAFRGRRLQRPEALLEAEAEFAPRGAWLAAPLAVPVEQAHTASRGLIAARGALAVAWQLAARRSAASLGMADSEDEDDSGSEDVSAAQAYLSRRRPSVASMFQRMLGKRISANSPLLTTVSAAAYGWSRWEKAEIVLPTDWAGKLLARDLAVWPAPLGKGFYFAGRGRLSADPQTEVHFTARESGTPETQREIRMSRLLAGTGVTPIVIESQVFPEATFIMTESVGRRSLDWVIRRHSHGLGDGGPTVPLNVSLPVMLDIVRALGILTDLGIVHGDLTEDDVAVVENRHALIVDFRKSCVVGSSDPELGCAALAHTILGSAYRHPPEAEGECPNAMSNDMWQLGLIFARMLLGGDEAPTKAAAIRAEMLQQLDDATPHGRWDVRNFVRFHFDVKEVPAYRRLSAFGLGDVLEILDGLLEKNPAERWRPQRVESALEKAARDRGIELPAPRAPTLAPEDWVGDWQ